MSVIQEQVNKQKDRPELPKQGGHFVVIKSWDKSLGSLQKEHDLEHLVSQIGLDLSTLAAILTKEFPHNLELEEVKNPSGEKIEDVGTEAMTVNGRPLDRLLVIAYPSVANSDPREMTQFKTGGEVILVTEGEAEITFAPKVQEGVIARQDLWREKVSEGDLIVSTDTPNNWTNIYGDKFTFIYFVGNPSGPQKYSEVPKTKVPVK